MSGCCQIKISDFISRGTNFVNISESLMTFFFQENNYQEKNPSISMRLKQPRSFKLGLIVYLTIFIDNQIVFYLRIYQRYSIVDS
jgi:hypothetical protein